MLLQPLVNLRILQIHSNNYLTVRLDRTVRTGSSNIAASAQSRKAVTWKATNKEKMHVNTWAIAFGLSQ